MLGDEMGLGKTVQAIRACDMVGALRVLVVCPASVRSVWAYEFPRWSLLQPETLIFSYSELVANPDRRAEALTFGADVIILDEAHYLKTPDSKRTKFVYSQLARNTKAPVWALTGTPAPNDPTEMWTHMRVLGGETMGYEEWAHHYCNLAPSDYKAFRVMGLKPQYRGELREKLRPWFLRRTLKGVGLELPPLRWGEIPIDAPKARATVEAYLKANPEVDEMVGRLLEMIDHAGEDGVGVDSMLATVSPYLATLRRITAMAKLPALLERLDEELASGLEQVVLFAHHREVIDALEKHYPDSVSIHGATPGKSRIESIKKFQSGESRVFIGQIVAAGTGLTLTSASHVVFVETSWSPADVAQAAKRIHRIGQDNPCLVRVASLIGSVDMIVDRVVNRKARMVADLLKEET
jgi:SWI/SNF-related matrix-associated actin-dependent regulator 1 of chromatin subfamily A